MTRSCRGAGLAVALVLCLAVGAGPALAASRPLRRLRGLEGSGLGYVPPDQGRACKGLSLSLTAASGSSGWWASVPEIRGQVTITNPRQAGVSVANLQVTATSSTGESYSAPASCRGSSSVWVPFSPVPYQVGSVTCAYAISLQRWAAQQQALGYVPDSGRRARYWVSASADTGAWTPCVSRSVELDTSSWWSWLASVIFGGSSSSHGGIGSSGPTSSSSSSSSSSSGSISLGSSSGPSRLIGGLGSSGASSSGGLGSIGGASSSGGLGSIGGASSSGGLGSIDGVGSSDASSIGGLGSSGASSIAGLGSSSSREPAGPQGESSSSEGSGGRRLLQAATLPSDCSSLGVATSAALQQNADSSYSILGRATLFNPGATVVPLQSVDVTVGNTLAWTPLFAAANCGGTTVVPPRSSVVCDWIAMLPRTGASADPAVWSGASAAAQLGDQLKCGSGVVPIANAANSSGSSTGLGALP